jgi:hypothetical protein
MQKKGGLYGFVLFAALVTLPTGLLTACPHGPIPVPPPVAVDCDTSFAHLEDLECSWAKDYKSSCNYHAGMGLSYPVVCVVNSMSCAEALQCR